MTIKNLHWLSVAILIVAFLLAMMDLSEFYRVAIAKQKDYPFGSINEAPWYYSSADTYGLYMGVEGVAILLASVGTLYFMWKKKVKIVLVMTLFSMLIICLALVSSSIKL